MWEYKIYCENTKKANKKAKCKFVKKLNCKNELLCTDYFFLNEKIQSFKFTTFKKRYQVM